MSLLARFVALVFVCGNALPLCAQTTDDSYAQIPVFGASGEKKLQSGDAKGAIEDFKKAFEASRDLSRQYPQEPAYSENAYFYLGRLASAFGLVNDIPSALQMSEPGARGYAEMATANPTPDNIEKATQALGQLAWYQVLSKYGPGAEASARQALALTPASSLVKVNLAHALLLNGKRKEALAIYTAEAATVTGDGRKVRDVILQDFADMEAAGIRNGGIADAQKALGGTKVSRGKSKTSAIMVWLIVLLVFLAIGAFFAALVYFDRQRTAKLEAAAKALGFTFRRKATPEDQTLAAGSPLTSVGRSRVIRNIIEVPETDGARMTLFDFSYVIGGGKQSRTFEQTVTRVQSPKLNLPTFDLRPESIFAKIAQSLGFKDIDIKDAPTFSKMFLLRGQDDGAIRQLFTPALRQYCEQYRGLWMSGAGDLLWFHRENRRPKPAELEAFATAARQTISLIASEHATSSPIPPPPLPPPPLPPV